MARSRKFLQLRPSEHAKLGGKLNLVPREMINQSLRYTNRDFYRSKKLINVLNTLGISENEYINRIRGIQEAGSIRDIEQARARGEDPKAILRMIKGLDKRMLNDIQETYVNRYGITIIITANADGTMTVNRLGVVWTGLKTSHEGLEELYEMVKTKHAERYRDVELDDDTDVL